MALRIVQIDVPRRQREIVTAFWADALTARAVDAPFGFVHLVDATSRLEIHVQAIEDGAPRYHLDVESSDREARVRDLLDVGATWVGATDLGFTVLAAPSGLLLCVIDPDAATPTPVAPRAAGRGLLDGVRIEVPTAQVETEVAFWTKLLEAIPGAPARSDDDRTTASDDGRPRHAIGGVLGPGGPVRVEVHAVDAPPRLQVELSTPDVPVEVERLLRCGASHVGDHGGGIVLADPAGNLLRLVPTPPE